MAAQSRLHAMPPVPRCTYMQPHTRHSAFPLFSHALEFHYTSPALALALVFEIKPAVNMDKQADDIAVVSVAFFGIGVFLIAFRIPTYTLWGMA
jgi:hypothetical protein